MSLELTVDAEKLHQAVLRAPEALERHLDRAIGRIVQIMARDARDRAPKAMSALTNSIKATRPSTLEGVVAPDVDYARAVEEGTGIHGTEGVASGAMPPLEHIEDWIAVRRIEPRDPGMDRRDLAWAIARSIARTGTPAQPYLAPAFEDNRDRAERLLDEAIDKALGEV